MTKPIFRQQQYLLSESEKKPAVLSDNRAFGLPQQEALLLSPVQKLTQGSDLNSIKP
ncbi:MAG: hypothetical protein AAGB12_15090 [Pseudomonadota bacterium]